jgi:hypothetical protein
MGRKFVANISLTVEAITNIHMEKDEANKFRT